MALTAFGWSFGQFLVAALTSDVERVLLGAGHGWIVRVGILAVALKAALGIIFSSGRVMTDSAIVGF